MIRFCAWALAAMVLIAAAGCGDGRLQTRGRVVKGGVAFVPPEGEFVRVTFYPMSATTGDAYAAEVRREDATFRVAGKDGSGMPPGKYRVAVEHDRKRSDLLKGKFGVADSPFTFDVTASTGEIVLDLDKTP